MVAAAAPGDGVQAAAQDTARLLMACWEVCRKINACWRINKASRSGGRFFSDILLEFLGDPNADGDEYTLRDTVAALCGGQDGTQYIALASINELFCPHGKTKALRKVMRVAGSNPAGKMRVQWFKPAGPQIGEHGRLQHPGVHLDPCMQVTLVVGAILHAPAVLPNCSGAWKVLVGAVRGKDPRRSCARG